MQDQLTIDYNDQTHGQWRLNGINFRIALICFKIIIFRLRFLVQLTPGPSLSTDLKFNRQIFMGVINAADGS